jgi:hypothetical protein
MLDAKRFIDAIELELEIMELRELGLTEEEVIGFIEVFYESWIATDDTILN